MDLFVVIYYSNHITPTIFKALNKASLKKYGDSCEAWTIPCDYSQGLKCLSDTEGSSCNSGYGGTKCNCIDTEYWTGSACVPKLLNGLITDHECKCRQDLGLEWLSYSSPYTCYTDFSPDRACACPNDEYWIGEKCVEKKTYFDYCVESCHCKENLGLTCQSYVNGYSCYSTFGSGMKCLCNYLTHWWNNGPKNCGNLHF